MALSSLAKLGGMAAKAAPNVLGKAASAIGTQGAITLATKAVDAGAVGVRAARTAGAGAARAARFGADAIGQQKNYHRLQQFKELGANALFPAGRGLLARTLPVRYEKTVGKYVPIFTPSRTDEALAAYRGDGTVPGLISDAATLAKRTVAGGPGKGVTTTDNLALPTAVGVADAGVGLGITGEKVYEPVSTVVTDDAPLAIASDLDEGVGHTTLGEMSWQLPFEAGVLLKGGKALSVPLLAADAITYGATALADKLGADVEASTLTDTSWDTGRKLGEQSLIIPDMVTETTTDFGDDSLAPDLDLSMRESMRKRAENISDAADNVADRFGEEGTLAHGVGDVLANAAMTPLHIPGTLAEFLKRR